jgi:hypothetical protein
MIYTTTDEKVIHMSSIQHQPCKHSNKWEEKYAEFEAHDNGMPANCTKSYFWKQPQLSIGPYGMDCKIEKEIEANEGSTMWSDRKVRLFNFMVLKSIAKCSGKWEKKYTEFKAHNRLPAKSTKSYNWKQHQLSS